MSVDLKPLNTAAPIRRRNPRHISLALEAALENLRPEPGDRLHVVPDAHDPPNPAGRAETAVVGGGCEAA